MGGCLFAFTCKLVHTHFVVFLSVCAKRGHISVCVQVICALTAMISAAFFLCSVCVCEVGVSRAPVVRLH